MSEDKPALVNPDQPGGYPEWGYTLNFIPAEGQLIHQFCGDNAIIGGECPHCEKPLMHLLSLDTADKVLALGETAPSHIPLLYCWTCSIPFDEFAYQIGRDGGVKILRVPPRMPQSEHGPEGPYDGFTGVFPRQDVALVPLSAEDQSNLQKYWRSTGTDAYDTAIALGIDEPRHQVGGYPFIYNPQKTACPLCARDMQLLAAICNDATGNDAFGAIGVLSFVDNGGVQMVFHLCRNCWVVSAYSSCD